jgi:hypothetical protein
MPQHSWEEIRDMVMKQRKRQEDTEGGEGEGGEGDSKCSNDGFGALMFEGKPLHRMPRTLERTHGRRK